MNWYKEIKFAAPPLPSEEGIPDYEEFGEIPVGHAGIEYVRNSLSEEAAEKERKANPYLQYLGSGNIGIAYYAGKDVVIKYTTDFSEYLSAKKILGMQQEIGGENLPGVVTVFHAEMIPANNVYKIYLESVRHLSEIERKIIYILREFSDGEIMLCSFDIFIKRTNWDNRLTKLDIEMDAIKEIYDKYRKLLISLENIHASLYDLHINNIGENNKEEYVALDVGGLFI